MLLVFILTVLLSIVMLILIHFQLRGIERVIKNNMNRIRKEFEKELKTAISSVIEEITSPVKNKDLSGKQLKEKFKEEKHIGISGKVDKVNQKIEEKFKEIERKFGELEKVIGTLNSNNIKGINNSLEQLKQDTISGIKEEIEGKIREEYKRIHEEIKGLNNKLNDISETVEELRKESQPVEEVKEPSYQAPSPTELEEEKPGQEEKPPSEPDIESSPPEGTEYEVYKNILDKSELINKLEEAGINLPDELKGLGEYYKIVSKYPSKKEGGGIYIRINDIEDSAKFTILEDKLLNLEYENFVRLLNDESVKRRPELRNEIRKFLESQGYRVIGEELRGESINVGELKKWAEIENKDEIRDLLSEETVRIGEVKDWGVIDIKGVVRKPAVVRVSRY